MTKKAKRNSGFIALMSAIIISVILLLMVTNLSLTGFYGRSNILDYELKERSSALAEGCADTAILRLIEDPSYTGNEIVNVGIDTCAIQSVASTSGEKTINIKAEYKNYVTKLKIVLEWADMSIVSWEEV